MCKFVVIIGDFTVNGTIVNLLFLSAFILGGMATFTFGFVILRFLCFIELL